MRAAIAVGLILAAARVASGQETPSPPRDADTSAVFEVASVRVNTGGTMSYSCRWLPDGRFRATNLALRALIRIAYDLRTEDQLIGAPGWIASDKFDVEAEPCTNVHLRPIKETAGSARFDK